MAALLATLLFAAVSVPALTDDNLSRSLALNRELSARNGIRVLEIPVEIGECWGKISSCPDVELVVTYATGDLYDPPVAYSLPASKGWVFVGWRSESTFVVRTAIPDSNIDEAERGAWQTTKYTVTIGETGALYSLDAPN